MSISASIAVAGGLAMRGLRPVLLAFMALVVPCASLAEPIIDVNKLVNGEDPTAPPGAIVPFAGSPVLVNFLYVLDNDGTDTLAQVQLIDDNGTPGSVVDDFAPVFVAGDVNGNGLLDLGETWFFAAVLSISTGGQHQNTVLARGFNQLGIPAFDADTAFFFLGTPETGVPEPNVLLLLGIALAGLAFSRRKRAV